MGTKELANLSGLAPETLDSNDNPDHGTGGSSETEEFAALDRLFNGNGDDQETGDEVEGDEGDGDDAGSENEADAEGDPDTEGGEDAGQNEGEGEQQEQAAANDDVLDEVPPEQMQQAATNYKAALDKAESELVERARPVVQQITARQQAISARLEELKGLTRDENGIEVPLSFEQQMEAYQLLGELQTLNTNKGNLRNYLQTELKKSEAEVTITHNLELYPKLKPFEKEYRHLVASGMDCSDADLVYTVCRQLRARSGQPLPKPQPQVTKAQIEQQAIQQNLERKQKAAVTTGAKGTGQKTGKAAARQLPDAAQRELAEITRAFGE